MAPYPNLARTRTHTLSDENALALAAADLPRRKSASALPATARRTRASSSAVPAVPALPPFLPFLPTSSTAPNTPSDLTASLTQLGPWGGTFLEADEHKAAAADAPSVSPVSPVSPVSLVSPKSQPLNPRNPRPADHPHPLDSLQLTLPSTNVRDSFISIVDDPFFQRFHVDPFDDQGQPSPAASAFPPEPSPQLDDPSGHEPPSPAAWPPPRRESLTIADYNFKSLPPKKMEAVNIAVIGATGVGKSCFVQRALRLSRIPPTNITAIRLDVESIPHVVALIELDLEYFDVDPSQAIQWPKQINGHMVPRIDGALILYDVMNKDSVRELPPTLSALSNAGLPTILVATKCDNPEGSRQINTEGMASVFPSIITDFKTSYNKPSSTRDCLQAIILACVYNRRGSEKNPETRRRAASSAAHLDTPPDSISGRTLSDQGSSKHNRASSDLSLLRGSTAASSDYRSQNSRSPRIEYPNTPQVTSGSFDMDDDPQTIHGMLRQTGIRLDGSQNSFLDVDSDVDAEASRRSEELSMLSRSDEVVFEKPKLAGTTFEDLVDRLLAAPMNRADSNFADVFLCLYRKFSPPSTLLAAVLARLNRVRQDKTLQFLERTADQFRIIEVIARWVSFYPGDFARPKARQQLEGLVRYLADEPIFAIASQQIRDHLENDVVEDDDTGWAECDDDASDNDSDASGDAPSSGEATPTGSKRGSDVPLSDGMRSLHLEETRLSDPRPPSDTGSSSSTTGPTQFQFHSQRDYEREAATMVPTATLPLNKWRWHIFMDMEPNDVGDEITRIDWIMFSSIHIRDLVRHVSLPLQARERCRSLKNVDRMINHFNHIAKWVANMVLIRDKAKHRAPCLQKFMLIAIRLRQLKNYNGLAAVLAGINSTSIHRLAATRGLVDADVQKRFAQTVILMATQKSHFSYRLAWENSPPPRIPFMPLHRRDLVSAEEGSRTFVGPEGDRINWKKFEVLGEVLMPIMRSQATPYPNLRKNVIVRETILDGRMVIDDEEIYQRSVQVEPITGSAEPLKKKFPWLPK